MIKVLQLIFSPFETWEKITMTQRGFFWVLGMYLLPLLAITLAIEGSLLARFGEKRGEFGLVHVPVDLAIRYAVAYGAFLLVSVFISAQFLSLASQSFNVRTTYLQSFVVMAYGFGPVALARILDGIPLLNTWVCWSLGAVTSASILYHGIGMVLRPDQTKGFGLYLISIMILVVISALAHFAALSVLHGKGFHPRALETMPVRRGLASLDSFASFSSGSSAGAVRVFKAA